MANTVLTFLFNIPITMALLLRAIKALSDGRGQLPAETTSTQPSATVESPGLRETMIRESQATKDMRGSDAAQPQPRQPEVSAQPNMNTNNNMTGQPMGQQMGQPMGQPMGQSNPYGGNVGVEYVKPQAFPPQNPT